MDLQIATYLGVSILICVLAFKAKWLLRVKWDNPRLYERPESTNQIVIVDSRAPQAAMAGLVVASRPSTIAGDIGLVLLVVWMIGFAAGGVFIPTAFGSLREVTTANVAMLLAAAFVWGFIFARLFLTAMRLFFLVVIPLVLLTAVAGFVAAFAMGGPDKLMKSIGLDEAVESAVNSPLLNDGAEKRLTRQITKNACSLFQSVVAMGDMDRVRNKCDEDWKEAVRLKQAQDAESSQQASLRNKANYRAHLQRMDQLASGIPLRAPKGNPVALPGTWVGSNASCTRRMTEYQLRMREGTGDVREGVMIMRWGNLGENPGYSAFRVRATLVGRKFTLSPVGVIQPGPEEMFEATGEIKDFSLFPMFLAIPSQSCSIRFGAVVS